MASLASPPVIEITTWQCCAQPAGAISHPDQIPSNAEWEEAMVPGTVAATLQKNRHWDFDAPRNLDAEDWWYRTVIEAGDCTTNSRCSICFEGLATLAEVWLNGRCILTTNNMFLAYEIEIGSALRPRNELFLVFRSLADDLKQRRPRPRWKTNLVNHQQLRWHRSSLIGRIPGWSPPVPVVGPWRAIHVDTRPFHVSELRLTSQIEGTDGRILLETCIHCEAPITRVALQAAGCEAVAVMEQNVEGYRAHASMRLSDPPLWWPHTHGQQPLTECFLHLDVEGERHIIPCGKVGFRRIAATQDDGFALHVNGMPVFCRGACWTISDIMTAGGTEEALARDLRLARDAGANMLRVSGTMIYESDTFYRLCDELGILIWQDFMFANMDYPIEDENFAANIEAEARCQLARLSSHPCVSILCGNSEVEQQAAMRGVPRELWTNRWFASRLPELCAEYHPNVVYVASTPTGGVMPFHVSEGIAHYYGVGAYLRSPREVRLDNVAFTSECLAFANVPEPETVNVIMDGASPVVHHPRWKQRVPRDSGAGWDFDDVRDFYLRYFFGVDAIQLRCCDPSRYLQLSRVVSGEMMAQVFAEWRSGSTRNHGGLVWFFKDLWPAAGWGIIDSLGLPKAAYYYLRRSWQTRQITITDEGLNGIQLHITNETAAPLHGFVQLLLLREGRVIVARHQVPCQLPPWSRRTFNSDAILDGFYDVTYSYRFGPPQHDIAIATLFDEQRQILSEAFYFVKPREPVIVSEVQLNIEAKAIDEGRYQITLACDQFLQSVSMEARGFLPDDSYFHLAPSRHKRVCFTAIDSSTTRFKATLEALNLKNPVEIRLKPE